MEYREIREKHMKHTEYFVSKSRTMIKFDVYLPRIVIRYKGIVQVHHGMMEYSDRYDEFARFLSNEGYIVVTTDFVGHGTSLYNFEQGYFGQGNAIENLVEDMHRLRKIIVERYPDLPYFILGNQLGSLVLRQYIAKYGDYIQGAIIMGTCGKLSYASIKKAWLQLHILLKGNMQRNKKMKDRITKKNNAKLSTSGNALAYLTRAKGERKIYDADPMTDFAYTNKALKEMIDITKEVSSKESIKNIPTYLSTFIISGEDDVYGDMSKGPRWLYEIYKKHGMNDLTLMLYPKSRHDILHEKNKKEVYRDILNWLDERTFV